MSKMTDDQNESIEQQIRALQRSARRLSYEIANSDTTEVVPFANIDSGYNYWTVLKTFDGKDSGIKVRTLLLPQSIDDQITIVIYSWDNGKLEAHKHKEVENLFVLQGELIMTIEEKEHNLSQGDSIVIPALLKHSGIAEKTCLLLGLYTPALPLIKLDS